MAPSFRPLKDQLLSSTRNLVGAVVFVSVAFGFSSSASSLEKIVDYNFDNDTFEVLSSMCPQVPPAKAMREEIAARLSTLPIPRAKLERLYPAKIAQTGAEFPSSFNILLDGFALQGISPAELLTISELTNLHPFDVNPFVLRYNIQFRGRTWAVAGRGCDLEDCIQHGLRQGHNFSRLNATGHCRDIFCAAERLFGKDRAVLTLWLYLKYGITSGPYVSPKADPKGFAPETLGALATAAGLMPPHLIALAAHESKFYQYRKGETLKVYAGRRILANASGQVFDGIVDYTPYERVGVFLHELGHRVTQNNDWDRNDVWTRITKSEFTSLYGFESPVEDFAESFVFYRAKPKYLKFISPKRYEYMKKVFNGIEYEDDLCRGKKAT